MTKNESWLRPWLEVAREFNHEVVRRWADAWGGHYRDGLVMLLSNRLTQKWLSDVTDVSHTSFQGLLNSPDDQGLHFDLDSFAESSGPRWAALPKGLDQNKLDNPVLRALSDAGVAMKSASGKLDEKNVMARFENGQLSVTLVSLGSRSVANSPTRTSLASASTVRGAASSVGGSYHLTFHGQTHEPIVLTVKEL
jgi:hypothetical protein